MNMENNKVTSRRNIIKGATWTAPVILATTAVPVYAASVNRGTCVSNTTYKYNVTNNSRQGCTTSYGSDIVYTTSIAEGNKNLYILKVYASKGSVGDMSITVTDNNGNQDFSDAVQSSGSGAVVSPGVINNVVDGNSSIAFNVGQELPKNAYIEVTFTSVAKPGHSIVKDPSTGTHEPYGVTVSVTNTPKFC